VSEPVKTRAKREDLADAVMLDVYPLCEWSNALVKFPNGTPPRKPTTEPKP
jgi:hypothetical protein